MLNNSSRGNYQNLQILIHLDIYIILYIVTYLFFDNLIENL